MPSEQYLNQIGKKNETYVKIDIPPNLTTHSPDLVQALQIDNTK